MSSKLLQQNSSPPSPTLNTFEDSGMNLLGGVWGDSWRVGASAWNQSIGRVPGVPKFQTARDLRRMPLSVQNGMVASQFIRYAGVSGAIAVILGAYGAHKLLIDPKLDAKVKQAFENGNKYHLIHSVALALVPFSSRPTLTGSLFLAGMTLFCGSCYSYAFTQNEKCRFFAPYGGMLLIAAWLSLCF